MAVFASFLFAQTALASTVTYKGQEALFEFDGGEGVKTKADLFGNLKDLYPGDTVEQPISIKNSNPKGSAIEVFLRAVPHDDASNPLSDAVKANEEAADTSKSAVENNQDFLSQLTLKVVNKATGKTIFEGTADKTGGLADPVSLGTLAKDEVVELTATLTVPSDLDSKYTGRLGELDWEFSVKEPVPALSVQKTVSSAPANGEYYVEGEKASFSIAVNNAGDFDLTSVVVSDPLTGLTETVDKLAAGASKTFETTYTVTAKDVTAGEVTNTASSTANDPTDPSSKITSESSVSVKTSATPSSALSVEKTVTSKPANGEYYVEDEKASFQIAVKNAGDSDLSGVAVSDPLTGLTETVDKLAAGESKTFETDYTVTAKDVTAGEVTNTASATADDPTDSSKKISAESSVKVKTSAESSSSSTPGSSGSSSGTNSGTKSGTTSKSSNPSTSGTSGTTTTTTSQTTPRTRDATASGVVSICVLAAVALFAVAALRNRSN